MYSEQSSVESVCHQAPQPGYGIKDVTMTFIKRAGKFGKRILIWILKIFVWPRSLPKEAFDRNAVQHVLVVRQDNRMGNLILITPLLRAIKDAFPNAQLDVLVGGTFADVLEGLPEIGRLIVLQHKRFLRNPFRFFKLLGRLKDGQYDLAIDASNVDGLSFNNGFLVHASKAPFRVGYRRGDSDLFLNIEVPPPDVVRHEIDIHLDLLRYLIGEVSEYSTHIAVSEEDRVYAQRLVAIKGVTQEDLLVGIHIGGRRDKRWLIEHFAALSDKLMTDGGAKVIIFYGSLETTEIKVFQERVKESPVILEPQPFKHLAALIERCDFFIAGDTGPMHLAVAMGTPTIAIFLVKNFRRYGPRGTQHRIVFDEEGSVDVDDVLFACQDIVNRSQEAETDADAADS